MFYFRNEILPNLLPFDCNLPVTLISTWHTEIHLVQWPHPCIFMSGKMAPAEHMPTMWLLEGMGIPPEVLPNLPAHSVTIG